MPEMPSPVKEGPESTASEVESTYPESRARYKYVYVCRSLDSPVTRESSVGQVSECAWLDGVFLVSQSEARRALLACLRQATFSMRELSRQGRFAGKAQPACPELRACERPKTTSLRRAINRHVL